MGTYKTIHALFLVIILTLLGCNRPIPNPESIDPIYQDLLKEAAAYQKGAIEEEKKLKEANAELARLEPRDPSRRQTVRLIYRLEKNATALKEGQAYFDVRAEQRKQFAKAEYLKAFQNGQPWPQPDEFAAYSLRKRLQNAPRNWDERVPKLTRHNRQMTAATKPPSEDSGDSKQESAGEAD